MLGNKINPGFGQGFFYFSEYDILFNKTKSDGINMKFEGTWLVVIILSIEVLAFGEFEQSNQILLIGGISFILSTLFEASILIRHFIKKQTKV